MDVGGKDFWQFGVPPTKEQVIEVVRKFWPDVVEEHDEEAFFPVLFLYKDKESKRLWDIDVTHAPMIQVILDDHPHGTRCLTVVTDGGHEDIVRAIFAINDYKGGIRTWADGEIVDWQPA